MLKLEDLKQWLIGQGYSEEELDEHHVPPVINEIGNGLMLSLQNDDDIGNFLISILINQDMLASDVVFLTEEVQKLKEELEALKNA